MTDIAYTTVHTVQHLTYSLCRLFLYLQTLLFCLVLLVIAVFRCCGVMSVFCPVADSLNLRCQLKMEMDLRLYGYAMKDCSVKSQKDQSVLVIHSGLKCHTKSSRNSKTHHTPMSSISKIYSTIKISIFKKLSESP